MIPDGFLPPPHGYTYVIDEPRFGRHVARHGRRRLNLLSDEELAAIFTIYGPYVIVEEPW